MRFKTEGLTGKVAIKGRYKFGFITLAEFVKLRAFRGQYKNGKTLISPKRVEELIELGPEAVLTNVLNIITLSYLGFIIQGNHRRGVAEYCLEMGLLPPDFEIPYIQDLAVQTMHDQSIQAMLGNVGGNRVNLEVQAVMGDVVLSKKVFAPIYGAIKMTNNKLTEQRVCGLAMKFGAIFNRNPQLVDKLRRNTDKLDLNGFDIYTAKNYKEANKVKFFNVDPQVNLIGTEEAFAKLLANGMAIIAELRASGVWKEKFNLKTNLEYIILAASIRNELVYTRSTRNKINIKTVIKNASRNGRRINDVLQKDFVNTPESAEDTILGYLFS